MNRFKLLIVVMTLGVGTPPVLGQTADATRQKERIELLEAKLKLAEREIVDLKKENEQLKAGGVKEVADDGFAVGAKLSGPLVRTWVGPDGKPVTKGNGVEIEVIKRSGKEFTGEFWVSDHKSGFEIEGTIDNGVVKFKSTKSLTEATDTSVVGLHTYTGRLEKGVLKATSTKKGEASYKGKLEVKVKKD